MPGISWLHLSDWHQQDHDFNREVVRDALLADIKARARIHPELQNLDFIIFSGDISYSGNEDEFVASAKHLIEPVLAATGCDVADVVMVPGNHDIDRSRFELLPESLQTPFAGEEEAQKWLTEKEKRSVLTGPFDAYCKFAEPYGQGELNCYASVLSRRAGDREIAFLGLNSALMSGRHTEEDEVDDHGHLTIGEHQIHEPLKRVQNADIRVAVIHHPFEWLSNADKRRVPRRLLTQCHFILTGHTHWPDAALERRTDGCILIQAGACYCRRIPEGREHFNSYNYVHVDHHTGEGHVFFRRWSDRTTTWVADSEVAEGGNWDFRLPITEVRLPITEEGTGDTPRILPPRPTRCLGRDRQLSDVEEHLRQENWAYLHGPGGVGKTTVASEAVHLLQEQFAAIIYHVVGDTSFDEVLNVIARSFRQNTIVSLPTQDKLHQTQLLLNTHPKTLICLDGIDNASIVKSLWPLKQCCSLLLASRRHPPHSSMPDIELGMLPRPDGIELFDAAYKSSEPKGQHDVVNEICELLGDLPMAIELFAHRAHISLWGVDSLLDHLRSAPLGAIGEPIRASVNLTYKNLEAPAKEFLAMLAVFEGRPFAMKAASSIWESDDGLANLSELIDVSLVNPVSDERYVLHQVIQMFAASLLEDLPQGTDFRERMARYFLEYTEKNRTNFRNLEIERENILATMDSCLKRQDNESYLRFAELILRKSPGDYAYGFLPQKGYWLESIQIAQKCVDLAPNDAVKARFFEHQGLFHYWMGDHEPAKQCYNKALALYKTTGHPYGEAIILHRLGFIFSDEGDYKQCEGVYRRSVEIAEEHNLPTELRATSIHLVGVILYHQGKYEESREKLQIALEMREAEGGLSSVAASVTRRRLAGTLRRLGKYDEAQEELDKCLRIEQAAENERNIARCLRQLGMLALDREDLLEARSCFEQSHRVFERIGNNKGIASVLTNLGEVDLAEGHLDRAKNSFTESLTLASDLRSRYGIAMNLKGLGEVLLQTKHFKEASQHFLEALRQLEAIGYVHLDDLCKSLNLATFRSLEQHRCHRPETPPVDGRCSQRIRATFDQAWTDAKPEWLRGEPSINPYLTTPQEDTRRGLSLIARLSKKSADILNQLNSALRDVAPEQYYYPMEDFHITIMTLIDACDSFSLKGIDTDRLAAVFNDIFSQHEEFRTHFVGITGTPECVLAQGFFPDETLDTIRSQCRTSLQTTGFGKRIEARHESLSAHVTLARFKNAAHLDLLAQKTDELSTCYLGVTQIKEIKLVVSDWFMTADKVTTLAKFDLRAAASDD